MATLRDDLANRETSTAVAQRDDDPQSIIPAIKGLAPSIRAATSGTPIDADRFARVAVTDLRRNPKLLLCSRDSILGGLMLSAQLGLEIGAALGHSWLIPFKTRDGWEAQWILGYKGIVNLAGRAGVSIVARAVHENDDFDFRIEADGDRLEHRPMLRGDRGRPWAYYSVGRWDGGSTVVVLSLDDVNKFRARSRAKDNGPWVTDFDAMALKTCVRRLAPWVPLSAQTNDALNADGAVTRGMDVDLAEIAATQRAIDAASEETEPDTDPAERDPEPASPTPTGEGEPAEAGPTDASEGAPPATDPKARR